MSKSSYKKTFCDPRLALAFHLANWRKQQGSSLKIMASDLGVAVSSLNGWETGKSMPSCDNLIALAYYTGIPPHCLICDPAEICSRRPVPNVRYIRNQIS
jgi:transcriptional regulator with XRE-family HTH domain